MGCSPKLASIKSTTETTTTTHTDVRERTIDTLVKTDTAYIGYQINCDSLGKATITAPIVREGKRTSITTSLHYVNGKNLLDITAISDSFKLEIKARDSIINTLTKTKETVEKTYVKSKGWFQTLKDHVLLILATLGLALLIYKLSFKK